jgi:putative heme iron utilization protein
MSTETESLSFPPDVVAAVLRHMNEDHAEDGLLICRAFGDVPSATSATITGVDGNGMDFTVVADGGERRVRIPWGAPISTRAEIRVGVVRLYREACAVLGVEPREEEARG